MLSIPHSLTGAFIASKLPHPALYIPISLGLHYLCDWIPHWDIGTGLSNGKRKRSTAVLLEIVELFISFGLIYWLFLKNTNPTQITNNPMSIHILIGALTGIVPDLIESPRNFLKWEPAFIKPFNQFHEKFHHSTPNIIVGLIPQLIVVLIIILLK